MKFLFTFFMALLVMTAGNVLPVAHQDSRAYRKKVDDFTVTPQQALLLAKKAHSSCRKQYFDQEPSAIIGDYYVFNVRRKNGLALGGFYINGFSGVVEFRTTPVVVYDSSSVDSSIYESVTICNQL